MVFLSKAKIEKLKIEYKSLRESLLRENEEQTIRGGALDSFEQAAAFTVSKEAKEKRVKELHDIITNYSNLPEYTEGEEIIIGKWFDLKIKDDIRRFQLVDPMEAEPTEGLISMESPLGRAVFKKKCGDEFIFSGQNIIVLQVL